MSIFTAKYKKNTTYLSIGKKIAQQAWKISEYVQMYSKVELLLQFLVTSEFEEKKNIVIGTLI